MDTFKKYDEEQKNLWTPECEKLLAEWSEKASCYRWLHGRCEKKYQRSYHFFSIPVIILSTLTGAANVGMDSFVPEGSKSIASAIVGSVNIFAGIISTLQNFLKVAELMEAHRIAGISWGKLQRNIAIELALHPTRRVLQSDFLKLSRAEYDRLIEAGPIIDDSIISRFNNKFKNYKVCVPSICNGLDKCEVYKNGVENIIEDYREGNEYIYDKQEEEIRKSKKNSELNIVNVDTGEDGDDRDDGEDDMKKLKDEFYKENMKRFNDDNCVDNNDDNDNDNNDSNNNNNNNDDDDDEEEDLLGKKKPKECNCDKSEVKEDIVEVVRSENSEENTDEFLSGIDDGEEGKK